MEDYTYSTEHYHANNDQTMDEYLAYHLPDNFSCYFQDGSYAEIINEENGSKWSVNASGDGYCYNHKITFEFIH